MTISDFKNNNNDYVKSNGLIRMFFPFWFVGSFKTTQNLIISVGKTMKILKLTLPGVLIKTNFA